MIEPRYYYHTKIENEFKFEIQVIFVQGKKCNNNNNNNNDVEKTTKNYYDYLGSSWFLNYILRINRVCPCDFISVGTYSLILVERPTKEILQLHV